MANPLPPWMRIWQETELRTVDLDPAKHRNAEWLERRQQWRTIVREALPAVAG
jgi:hypothetical protein